MPPDPADAAGAWIEKARHDLRAIEKILTPDCRELDVAGFHCQQVCEKALKALLVKRQAAFEKTHDLRRLFDLCEPHFPSIAVWRDRAEALTLFAVAFRYPGPEDPHRHEVDAAFVTAREVLAEVERLLGPPARPLEVPGEDLAP
jgi:HEPN domain-containing protein